MLEYRSFDKAYEVVTTLSEKKFNGIGSVANTKIINSVKKSFFISNEPIDEDVFNEGESLNFEIREQLRNID